MSSAPSNQDGTFLESKKYHFIAEGTMPVLNFQIRSGAASGSEERLTLEIYHPMSGEVFEAKFGKGRIEVDRDGSVTYFTMGMDHASFSVFLERNVSISIDRSGEVKIKTPSKIVSVQKEEFAAKDPTQVGSDSVVLKLE